MYLSSGGFSERSSDPNIAKINKKSIKKKRKEGRHALQFRVLGFHLRIERRAISKREKNKIKRIGG
jgi:hypothetical protein